MKKPIIYVAIFSMVFIISSCKEEGPDIDLKPQKYTETTYISTSSETPQIKMILIEDFTGATCPNCPKAAQVIGQIQTNSPDRIVATSIYFDFPIVGKPVPGSKYDFRIKDGQNIFNMLTGQKNHLPIGAINRTKHNDNGGNFVILQDYNTWTTYFNEELSKNSGVNIKISGTLVDSLYKLKINLHYTQPYSDTQALTIYMVEDSIIDFQKLPDNSIDSFYMHKHVLKQVVSNYSGDNLKANLVLNRVVERTYTIKIDPKWNLLNCKIIAFVHKKNGFNFEIIQVQEKSLL